MKIREFHCIMPIANVNSVLEHGLLSYDRASNLAHRSIAMPEIQERRDQVQVPGGLRLHRYANLYLNARNPMLFKRKSEVQSLCILRVSTKARHIQGAVLTDCNASSRYVRFLSIDQVSELDLEAIYSKDWRHPDDCIAYFRHKSQMCAEFLVPNRLPPEFIVGAYVVDRTTKRRLGSTGCPHSIIVNRELFFS